MTFELDREAAAREVASPIGEPQAFTREEYQRILRGAYRLRAEARARVFGWPVRALVRLARWATAALTAPPAKRAEPARRESLALRNG